MATCKSCGVEILVWEAIKGHCERCLGRVERFAIEEEAKRLKALVKGLVVTTETFVGDVERLDVVATEVVLGMNIFKDVLANVRDIFGGRSGTVQNTLEEARLIAFEDLRMKAAKLGADAVIAVDIDYNSISTGSGINMMMVSVSGTAIRWKSTS